ncbi:dnaJ homolog subfamily C member 11-like [Zophobas morio]|uniref:dnaJ homolog subfamily C member 11-like n=1 Tax=Zophobas morio TaxID=2755281 RepID=UPI00308284FB
MEETTTDSDYYNLLNVPKNADLPLIKNAYRQACLQYHPDKHPEDERREFATSMFAKIQAAYDTLSDKNKREIYDLYGVEGLRALTQVSTSHSSLREEVERIKRERQEERQRQRTNAKSKFHVSLNAQSLFCRESRFLEKLRKIELAGMSISQSVQAPLTANGLCTLQGNVLATRGNGVGTLQAKTRYNLSDSNWIEFQVGGGSMTRFSSVFYQRLGKLNFLTVEGHASRKAFTTKPGFALGSSVTFGRHLLPGITGHLSWHVGASSSLSTRVRSVSRISSTSGTLQVARNGLLIAGSYEYVIDKTSKATLQAKFGTGQLSLEYGAEMKFSSYNTFGMRLLIGIPHGVILKIKFSRAGHVYASAIQLSELPTLEASLFGTFVPLTAAWAISKYLINPLLQYTSPAQQEYIKQCLLEKRKEAEFVVNLMADAVKKIIEEEERKQGLIIVKALYGDLNSRNIDWGNPYCPVIDVTIPLQNLVRNSQLHLSSSSKSGIPGIYDCCPAKPKQMKIQYRFRTQIHQCFVEDNKPLSCPKRSHILLS